MRFKKILRRQVNESQLECTISSWKRRAQFCSPPQKQVGRVTSECDVWPEGIQQLIST